MISIRAYEPAQADIWNRFVGESKNGLFLFDRRYMDYHSDRFRDNSLMVYNGDELIGLLPANRSGDDLVSHGGLTFGGVISGKRMTAAHMLQTFDCLKSYCREQEIRTFYYKAIPYFYHRLPAQEDLYALFRHDAVCYRRDAGSLIDLGNRIGYGKGTKASLSKGRKNNLRIEASDRFDVFMAIEEEILRTKYGTRPTHTAAEISSLAAGFPEQIRLYLVYRGDDCLGGTILFETDTVAHTQYIGITDEGKETGALDTVTDYLLQQYAGSKKYFSFGISTVDNGMVLNEGLIRNKESFGARTVVLDSYKMSF